MEVCLSIKCVKGSIEAFDTSALEKKPTPITNINQARVTTIF